MTFLVLSAGMRSVSYADGILAKDNTFAVSLLQSGVSLETVSILLGHKNISVTQKHYAPWVKSLQDALEAAVKGTS